MILTFILIFLSAVANAVMDKISFHHGTSIFKDLSNWWNPQESWRYKWKNGDKEQGERFPLSSTWLVGFTDAWHCFKFFMRTCSLVAVILAGHYGFFFHPLIDIAILFGIQITTFHVFFTYIFQMRSNSKK